MHNAKTESTWRRAPGYAIPVSTVEPCSSSSRKPQDRDKRSGREAPRRRLSRIIRKIHAVPSKRSIQRHERSDKNSLGIEDSLVQLSFVVQALLGRVAASCDLSIIQARMLCVLRDREFGMRQLAEVLNLEKSSLSDLVGRAERRGRVQRTVVSENRRITRVRLTPDGLMLAETFNLQVGLQVDALLVGLSDTDHRRLAMLSGEVVLRDADA